jgi:alpha-tubulin suppressor-like RCC1 family protein
LNLINRGIATDLGRDGYTLIPQKLELENIEQISAGNYFSIALSTEKKLYSWGLNNFGKFFLLKLNKK